jgi:hypothetical protein
MVKVKDLLEILYGGIPSVRIVDVNVLQENNRDDAGVMACEYWDSIAKSKNFFKPFEDCEVVRFKVTHEVSHKQYKEKGLIPPFRPDLTAEYELGDLKQKTYYDIYIDGSTAGDDWKK